MKKVMLTKSKSPTETQSLNIGVAASGFLSAREPPNMVQNLQIFEQRKAMKSAYVDLFKALFKIPDKNLQQRVMDAINGVQPAFNGPSRSEGPCDECKRRGIIKRETSNVGTQTEQDLTEITNNSSSHYENNNPTKSPSSKKCLRNTSSVEVQSAPAPAAVRPITLGEDSYELPASTANVTNSTAERKRKKRKLKNYLPRVIKHSHVQSNQLPLLNNKSSNSTRNDVLRQTDNSREDTSKYPCETATESCQLNDDEMPDLKRQRCESVSPLWFDITTNHNLLHIDCSLQYIDVAYRPDKDIILHKIYNLMEKEYIEADKPDEHDIVGYLPIHHAVCENDLGRLRRQIYVWQKLKCTHLNAIFTNDDKDCMEVALCHNSSTATIEVLLDAGYDVNCCYDVGNVLHLAIYNEVDLDTVTLLARKVDFARLYSTNDDGHTPLFLALRRNKFLCFEAILEIIDERLNLKSFRRPLLSATASEQDKVTNFTKFYAQQCENMADCETFHVNQSKEFLTKQIVLNEPDPKSGSTMLLFAVERQIEHFILLLLANLADPLIKNYSGQDARSYYNEYGLSLPLKMSRYLDKVTKILH